MSSSLNLNSAGTVLTNWKSKEVALCVAIEAEGLSISFCGFIVDVSTEALFVRNIDPWGMPQEQLLIKLKTIKTFEYYDAAESTRSEYTDLCGLISSVLVMTGERMKFAVCERVPSAR